MNKRCKKQVEIKLPDCVISYIFSKLSLKDLVKTSTLSKQWRHEWGFKMDLNFDLHNMFDFDNHNTIRVCPESHGSKFATKLDQFMLQHQGAIIRSIQINFPLVDQHRDVIDRIISKGIAKGAKRIELLLSYNADFKIEPYKFSFNLLSDTDSLTHLYLQNCRLVMPMEFSGLKNLKALVLNLVGVKQDMVQDLFSTCIHLVEFTLDACNLKSDLKIISPTLLYLNINNCEVKFQKRRNIDIIASNLSSIQYFCESYRVHNMNIKAPVLSKFSFRGARFFNFVGYCGLKNVTTIVLGELKQCLQNHVVSLLFSKCLQLQDVTFKNSRLLCDLDITSPKLHHLNILDCSYSYRSPLYMIIDASNLSSFGYSGHTTKRFFVKAPRLLKLFWNAAKRQENPYPFGPLVRLKHIENLDIIITHSQITKLSEILVQFHNLRQLNLLIEGAYDPNMNYFCILDIAMASQHLQKISLTIRNSHLENSHMVGFKRQRREYVGFSHSDLKCVELCGCVCTINVIELASQLLRNANSLEQITFSSSDKFYMGGGRWTQSSQSCWFDQNLVHEMLKDEVKENCRLTIL